MVTPAQRKLIVACAWVHVDRFIERQGAERRKAEQELLRAEFRRDWQATLAMMPRR